MTDILAASLPEEVKERQRRLEGRLRLLTAVTLAFLGLLLAGMIGLGILGLQAYQNQQQTLQLLQQQTNARTALTCLVVKETTVELEAIRSLADHFGTSIPIVPGETRVPIQCKPTGGDDVVIGTSYADDLRGTIRADFMSGEGGNDTIRPQGGSDVVFGGEGSDRLYSLARDHQADRLYGGTGSDVCFVRGSDVTSSCRRVVYP